MYLIIIIIIIKELRLYTCKLLEYGTWRQVVPVVIGALGSIINLYLWIKVLVSDVSEISAAWYS